MSGQQLAEAQKLEQQFRGGVGWFYAIAGLSLVNAVAHLSGAKLTFVVGLAATQIVTAIALEAGLGAAGKTVAFLLAALIAGIFLLFGIFARKRQAWAFIVGSILYAGDGLVFLLFKDMLAVGFHVLALVFIIRGMMANRQLKHMHATLAAGERRQMGPEDAPL